MLDKWKTGYLMIPNYLVRSQEGLRGSENRVSWIIL